MSEKSQTVGDFTFCRPSQSLPIYWIVVRSLSQILPILNFSPMFIIYVIGGLESSNRGLVMSEVHPRTSPNVPDGTKLSFYMSGIIVDHRRNLGCVGKIETLLIQNCPRPSQTIRDIYDFEFSFVAKIWDRLSGNSKVPDSLGFFQNMKTRL